MVVKIGRNEPCSCGSGLKAKKCCGAGRRHQEIPSDLRRMLQPTHRGPISKHGLQEDYDRWRSELENFFIQYDPADVWFALNISDLWLPNISSQVKHCFAFSVMASIATERFVQHQRIDSYALFESFIMHVHQLLPSFPTLEDYVPEMDWGEVKVASRGQFLRIFYGGPVERIPDYIEAFRISRASIPAAQDDLHFVLGLQNRLLSAIDKSVAGSTESVSSGHIEIPADAFWLQCDATLRSLVQSFPAPPPVSARLIIEQGSYQSPTTWSAFDDGVMTGTALPGILIRIGDAHYPVAIRSTLGNLIDFWARDTSDSEATLDRGITEGLAQFLIQRVDERSIVQGPLFLTTRTRQFPPKFAALLITKKRFYFVIAIDEKRLSLVPRIQSDLHNLAAGGDEWAIRQQDGHGAVQFRHSDGHLPRPDEITLIAVLPRVGTANGSIMLPKTRARILFLPDFISIFDSLSDLSEFDRYWSYIDQNSTAFQRGFIGPADTFAAFRASSGVMVSGANTPDMIMLDPHWGSNWRYSDLAEFWKNAPRLFPDDASIAWRANPVSEGVQQLISKSNATLSWCTTISSCTLHFVFHAREDIDPINGQMLELLVHCLADSTFQRRAVVQGLPLFERQRIVMVCQPDDAALASEHEPEAGNVAHPLFSAWKTMDDTSGSSITVSALVNLARAMTSLTDPTDSRFEAECVGEWISGFQSLVGDAHDPDMVERLNETASRLPRFTVQSFPRTIDAPDFVKPASPEPRQYKLARRELAIVLKNANVAPGRHELTAAKAIIDPARDAFRALIHARIAQFSRDALIVHCIEQHDAVVIEYKQAQTRLKYSLNHEVSYDRSQALADAHDKYLMESRNYRYLLECCLSMPSTGTAVVTIEDVVELIASVDWLFVLYSASDILHNGLDVAGISIDNDFVPKVFYSADRRAREADFSLEQAGYDLGVTVDPNEESLSGCELDALKSDIDVALQNDMGFTLTQFIQFLSVLMRWQSAQDRQDFRLSYQATAAELSNVLLATIENLTADEANRLIAFATLQPTEVRRLLGKTTDESDVPVWDHTKRGSRYAIRPLVPMDSGMLIWGAAATERSRNIWMSSITNGYLPADFPWAQVRVATRTIKEALERKLESRSLDICSRFTPYVEGGIDFKFRFPSESFADVGDFDVLAYWPATNCWLAMECKYNQRPFCLKDARRLRDRIFGVPPDRGQFSKIERRLAFLGSNLDHIRKLLGWPDPTAGTDASIKELYVSRDIYWWMRNPPFEVSTQFVRIDALDRWLLSNIGAVTLDSAR